MPDKKGARCCSHQAPACARKSALGAAAQRQVSLGVGSSRQNPVVIPRIPLRIKRYYTICRSALPNEMRRIVAPTWILWVSPQLPRVKPGALMLSRHPQRLARSPELQWHFLRRSALVVPAIHVAWNRHLTVRSWSLRPRRIGATMRRLFLAKDLVRLGQTRDRDPDVQRK